MTLSLSRQKIKKLLKLCFAGRPQPVIAERLDVTQATVSHYLARFNELAEEIGLPKAAGEYDIMSEVQELRSLAVELANANLTTVDARYGANIIKKFNALGIPPESHDALVEACKHADDPAFPQAVVELSLLEKKTGMTYQQVVTHYQQVEKELPKVESSLENKKKLHAETSVQLTHLQNDLNSAKDVQQQYEAEAKKKMEQLDKEVADKMKEAKLKKDEVEMAKQLKATIAKHGFDLQTILKLAKEFDYGHIKQ